MIQNWAQGPLGAQTLNPQLTLNPQVILLLQSVSQQLQQLQQIEHVRVQQLQQIQQLVQYVAHQVVQQQLAQPSLGGFTQSPFGQPYQSLGAAIPGSLPTSPFQVM